MVVRGPADDSGGEGRFVHLLLAPLLMDGAIMLGRDQDQVPDPE